NSNRSLVDMLHWHRHQLLGSIGYTYDPNILAVLGILNWLNDSDDPGNPLLDHRIEDVVMHMVGTSVIPFHMLDLSPCINCRITNTTSIGGSSDTLSNQWIYSGNVRTST